MKKVKNQTVEKRASGQNPQTKKPNRPKTVGQHCKPRIENRLTGTQIFGDTTKKKSCDNIFVTAFWWELVDSNDFMPPYPAKILTRTAKKIPCPCTFYWMGDFNLRGVNQKCGQKCGQTAPRPELFCSLTAPHQSVILGYLSDATKSSRPKNTSL